MAKDTLKSQLTKLLVLVSLLPAITIAQFGSAPLGEGPWDIQTYQAKIHIDVIARGLPHPWSLAFLPNGDMLVTEREGNLRLIHEGKLVKEPVAGLPDTIYVERLLGLMEVLPHPEFEKNHLLFLTYHKLLSAEPKQVATVLARARYENNTISEVQELLVTDAWDGAGGGAARLAIGSDNKLYMGVGATRDGSAQDILSLRGKILRLNLDGSVPEDNPFAGLGEYRPEIFSLGHRNPSGLAVHPETGELWEVEYGPNGGDEVNIIHAGTNYGWPLVSFGREYSGPYVSPSPHMEGMQRPLSAFIPGISPSGLSFYTGTDFPTWTTSAFIGAQRVGQLPGTGRMVRIFYDGNGDERQREDMLQSLNQRIRDIRMGPDGLLYFLTEEQDGALLVIKKAD